MKRINVIGTSGSGKSTFSRKLAGTLGYPCIEMDRIYWRPNWEEADDETFLAELQNSICGESWVLDGNYSKTQPVKWKSVDTVIWLDYGFLRTFYQVVCRSIERAVTKTELWPGTGNRESFRRTFFSRDSIVLWMLTSYRKNKKRYANLIAGNEYPHVKFIRISSPKQAREFVKAAGSD